MRNRPVRTALIAVLVGFQGKSTDNVYVTDVSADSPAQTAGWQPGDRFVSIEGREVGSVGDVSGLTRPDDIPADGAPYVDVLAEEHALERRRLFHA